MSTTETDAVQIDMQLVEELIAKETAALDAKHARSLSYRCGSHFLKALPDLAR